MNIKRLNKPSLHIAILIFIVLVFYAHTFDSGFMFDDYAQQEMLKLIRNNQRGMNMFNFITTPEEVSYYTQMTALPWWTSPKWRLKYFRPIATFSHLIDYSLWGNNPLPYHINNVIWYSLLVILIYGLYYLFCKNLAMAFCGALVFALEPCHYMTVRWLASRNDIICATFLVSSLICYLRFSGNKKPLYGFLSIFSYLLALLTKELAFFFPVLVVAHDWIRYKRFKEMVKCQWKAYLSLVMINSIYFAFYLTYGYGSYWYGETSLKNYLLEFIKASSLYLCDLFYGLVIAPVSPDFLSRYWFFIVILLMFLFYLVYLIWKEREAYPEISFFLLWMFFLLPFIVVPPINDRLLLIPSIGYAYLVALVIFKFKKRWLTILFIIYSLIFPLITNVIQAGEYDKAVQSNYERLYSALDEIIPHKTSKEKLFFLNFPEVNIVNLGISGDNYMYLALYFALYYQYPQWRVAHLPLSDFDDNLSEAVSYVKEVGIKVYPLSAFGGKVLVKLLDDRHIKISHQKRFYFESNTEKLFSLNRSFSQGETFLLPDVKISIDEMEGEKVKSIEVEFVESVDNPYYYFLYFDKGKWQRWYPQKGGISLSTYNLY